MSKSTRSSLERYGCAATTLLNHAHGSVKKSSPGRPSF